MTDVKAGATPSGKYDAGTLHETKHYGKIEVLRYNHSGSVLVKFLDTNATRETRASNIGARTLRDLTRPMIRVNTHVKKQYVPQPIFSLTPKRG